MEKCNKSIECTVGECRHHSCCEDFCTLDKILIGTHESHPTMDECTDCKSFDRK